MQLNQAHVEAYLKHMEENERSCATLEKYGRDLEKFHLFLPEDKTLSKERVQAWKEELIRLNYRAASVNSMLASVNGLLSFLDLCPFRVKPLKRQRAAFCEESRELNRDEYIRLVEAARNKGNRRLELILETICSTGIRVSELQYITVAAVRSGCADLRLKGKCRRILLPKALIQKLRSYIKDKKLTEGFLFRTKSGKPVSRFRVWAEMKALCDAAGVERSKVFPHNLRHLFARVFYALDKDIAKLADLLGHSSIETTRLYIVSTGCEHLRKLNRMRLIS